MNEIMQKLGVNMNVSFALIFYTLIWVRMLTILSVIPFLFGKPVPKMVSVGGSMVLAAFAYGYIVPEVKPPLGEDVILLAMLYLKEAFIGLLIGFGAGLIFHGFEAAGQMIDNQRGMSIARVLIPELGAQSSLVGAFLFQFAIVIYLSMGGAGLFFDAVFGSYQAIPLLEFPKVVPGFFPLMDLFMRLTGVVILISLQIAAPVIIVILLADIILGVANRIAPQINVWELGFNVKGYLGVLALFWSITLIANQIEHYSFQSIVDVKGIIEMIRGT